MSLLIATGGVAYVANVYQKRASFIDALKEEWRDIIAAKSALFSYTQLERPTLEQYLTAFCKLSETIDNMRSVYRNVGETGDLIGIYPYVPLHDMRRALQTLDPRKNPNPDAEARNLARDAILQSFYALRETFLEELDLEAPDHPLLISGGRRSKASGATRAARRAQERQQAPAGPRAAARSAHRHAAGGTERQGEHHGQALAPTRRRCTRRLAQRPWRVRLAVIPELRAAKYAGIQTRGRRSLYPGPGSSRCDGRDDSVTHRPADVNTGSCRAACFFCSTLSAACAALMRRAMANRYSITSVGSSAVAYRSGW